MYLLGSSGPGLYEGLGVFLSLVRAIVACWGAGSLGHGHDELEWGGGGPIKWEWDHGCWSCDWDQAQRGQCL